MITEHNFIEQKQITMQKGSEPKWLNIFNAIYNPKHPSIHQGKTQIEGINISTHHTSQQLQHTSLKTTNDQNIRKENRRNRLPNKTPTKKLPKLSKQQKIDILGFKSVANVNDPKQIIQLQLKRRSNLPSKFYRKLREMSTLAIN